MEKIWSQVISPDVELGKHVVLQKNSPSATYCSDASSGCSSPLQRAKFACPISHSHRVLVSLRYQQEEMGFPSRKLTSLSLKHNTLTERNHFSSKNSL